ncbi:hypothetical protein [Actinophytocola glycyrrhizae]|uniref:Uncharacterized protein n=1 Tax=Actinophytocola glycyrrhizae TaxID=2044873 RepID=A0ABV9RUQ8_9PSEU
MTLPVGTGNRFARLTSGQTTSMVTHNGKHSGNHDDAATVDETLEDTLADLTFPAEKWEVTNCADIRGVPVATRRRLYDLPCRTFESAEDVAAAL